MSVEGRKIYNHGFYDYYYKCECGCESISLRHPGGFQHADLICDNCGRQVANNKIILYEPEQEEVNITQEEEFYLTDDMYLPIHYLGMKVEQPYYPGDGNLSVHELQKLCNQFKEYIHQQQIIKQNCMKHIVELKFKKKF